MEPERLAQFLFGHWEASGALFCTLATEPCPKSTYDDPRLVVDSVLAKSILGGLSDGNGRPLGPFPVENPPNIDFANTLSTTRDGSSYVDLGQGSVARVLVLVAAVAPLFSSRALALAPARGS